MSILPAMTEIAPMSRIQLLDLAAERAELGSARRPTPSVEDAALESGRYVLERRKSRRFERDFAKLSTGRPRTASASVPAPTR